jgi:hypothetical protein
MRAYTSITFTLFIVISANFIFSQSLLFKDDFTCGHHPSWQVIGKYWEFTSSKVYSSVDPIYVYEYMIAGDFAETKKMVLMK